MGAHSQPLAYIRHRCSFFSHYSSLLSLNILLFWLSLFTMSGTSYVSSPSKGSSLSSDAPAFVPSFLRNRAIPIQRPSSTPSSTPPPSRVSTPVARKSPPPLPIGQVAQGKLSLQQPFDELNYQTLTSLKDPENELKSVSSYICQTYFRHHSDARPGKKCPVICAPVPSSAEGEARRLAYVFAMGTFEGHTDATLPLVLKRFAIPVVTLRSNADITNSPNSIRITPTWNLPEKEYCWIIAIPVGIPLSEAPTDKWHGAVKGYALEPEELKKLVAFSDQRLAEFKAMSQNNQSFEEYVKTLRTSRDERPKVRSLLSLILHCAEVLHR